MLPDGEQGDVWTRIDRLIRAVAVVGLRPLARLPKRLLQRTAPTIRADDEYNINLDNLPDADLVEEWTAHDTKRRKTVD